MPKRVGVQERRESESSRAKRLDLATFKNKRVYVKLQVSTFP